MFFNQRKIVNVRFKKVHSDAVTPTYSKYGDACCDLYSVEYITLKPMEYKTVDTGIVIETPFGWEAQIRPRSGLAFKQGITVLNTPGTIDSGYRGNVIVILINLGKKIVSINKHDRIAQLKFTPVFEANFIEVDELSDTDRGDGGFGSTGK